MNDLTLLDLAILKKIDAESTVESFGSKINTSFFETANILGTMKIKGYITIEPSVGGLSRVAITDAGMSILALAEKKASEPMEPLDNAILYALARGAKDFDSLKSQLNIRSGDLTYHVNKMVAQGFLDYEVLSGRVNIMLTEKGFNSVGGMKSQSVPAEAQSAKKDEHAKAEIDHMLAGLDEQEKKAGKHAAAEKEGGKAKKEEEEKQGHEDKKKREKYKRLASKISYYVSEYLLWIILAVVSMATFLLAVYLIISGKYEIA